MSKTYLYLFLIFGFLAIIMLAPNTAFADVIPPNKQLDLNFSSNEVVCKENLVKVIRTANENAVCVKMDAIGDLVNRGIIQSPTSEKISNEAEKQTTKPVGKIIHMATTKPHIDPGEIQTSKKIGTYNYVIKVCAEENDRIKAPEIIISSDSETKSIKIPRDIRAESCNTTATKVRALDPNTITSRLLNQGGITEIITEFENKIENLKLDLTEQREKVSAINKESSSNDRAKKVFAIHKKITEIRNELKDVRAEMQKYLLFLSMTSTSDLQPIQKGKSITGTQVDDSLAEIVSIHKALIQPENPTDGSTAFNVVLDVCTDKNILRIPVVQLSSDIETKTVKMAEKIAANSCQVTTAKINAIDANSISIQLAGQTENSATIIDLEKKITELKNSMKIEQDKLNQISTSSTINKEERLTTINESTIKIDQLRKELNSTKVELHKLLLQVYR